LLIFCSCEEIRFALGYIGGGDLQNKCSDKGARLVINRYRVRLLVLIS